MASRAPDAAEVREAVIAVSEWLRDETTPVPERTALARAVRLTARVLAAVAPGASVEVRIPPFVAVQCISGPRHTRGTPPNVVETDPRTWLLLSTGQLGFDAAIDSGLVSVSGSRSAVLRPHFPLVVPEKALPTRRTAEFSPSFDSPFDGHSPYT